MYNILISLEISFIPNEENDNNDISKHCFFRFLIQLSRINDPI